ncbi:MAG: hypothetical protein KIT68_12655 [Phycisphaeraceae bacterium]|nr:hypothetical protein [Phycisphaeraceae bacterium]
MPDPTHTPAARRLRCRADAFADPRTRRRELVDLIATGLARIAGAPTLDMPREDSHGDGLELPDHAALSVVARGPTGEHPLGTAGKAGEQHG